MYTSKWDKQEKKKKLKTFGFLKFSEGVGMEYWAKIGHRVLQFIGPDGRDPIDTGRK